MFLISIGAGYQASQATTCTSTPDIIYTAWRRKWQPTPVFLPGESHGQRSLAGIEVPGTQATSRINTIIYITLKIRNVPNYLHFLFLSISSESGYTHGVRGNADFYQCRKIIQTV